MSPLTLNPSNLFGECVLSLPAALGSVNFKLLFLKRETLLKGEEQETL